MLYAAKDIRALDPVQMGVIAFAQFIVKTDHASLATTTVYVTTEQRKRMQAVEGFWSGR
jgi:hypothetical protein